MCVAGAWLVSPGRESVDMSVFKLRVSRVELMAKLSNSGVRVTFSNWNPDLLQTNRHGPSLPLEVFRQLLCRSHVTGWIPVRIGCEIVADGIARLLEGGSHVNDAQAQLAQKLHKMFVHPAFIGLVLPEPECARGNDQNHGIIVCREFDQFIAA